MEFHNRQECSVVTAVRREVVQQGDEWAVELMQQPSGVLEVCASVRPKLEITALYALHHRHLIPLFIKRKYMRDEDPSVDVRPLLVKLPPWYRSD